MKHSKTLNKIISIEEKCDTDEKNYVATVHNTGVRPSLQEVVQTTSVMQKGRR